MVDLVNKAKNVATGNIYSDIDLFFTLHPITKDITLKTDAEAVKRSVRNIVSTNFYERPFKPNFGSNLRSKLFETNDSRGRNSLIRRIEESISMLEPRVRNLKVSVADADENAVNLLITYTIVNSTRPATVEFKVTRTR